MTKSIGSQVNSPSPTTPSSTYPLYKVPGMKDNPRYGIRRGKMRMTGADIRAIFEPVVKEILGLVKGQIQATKTTVKAVLMVGGFGQNAYLRDRIREAIKGDKIEVMQSPNG